MNYYERYCGDYQRDTAHLSLAEHGAYTMLLDTYFSVERPLPSDLTSLYRVCRAMTRLEQQAVMAVAEQFFPISEVDGLRHNQRADREIAKARPKIEAARINGRKGGRPSRQDTFREARQEASRIPDGLPVGSGNLTDEICSGQPDGKARQFQHQLQHQFQHQLQHQPDKGPNTGCTPAICLTGEQGCEPGRAPDFISASTIGDRYTEHTEHTEPSLPEAPQTESPLIKSSHTESSPTESSHTESRDSKIFHSAPPGMAGTCCKTLVRNGVRDCNPHHPTFVALLQAGAVEEEFLHAAQHAAARGKASFAYVVGTVKRQREEAAKLVLHQGRMPNRQELLESSNRAAANGWRPPELREPELGKTEPGGPREVQHADR
ncbi:YdaU family protein [Nitrosovibrio tenuis]|uniref:Uncharacterized conserved protein YdaU, DUF1376 family n=1 Tax=Nitrosovibrio tenuis TaxID=1233 RepID=A0A1H7IFS4_9PROT|nr:YdaU family protein [Nitrosovibrio tenuis]SEK61413.1 Uncharacterized conserved protein YdaU, DUF1376 family [Nitrosovibrio tenuis]